MKKTGILNQPISALVSGLGHTDQVVIADAGLPIPVEVPRIDLALKAGYPSFLETLQVVLTEMEVERAVVAQEMADVSPAVYTAVQDLLGEVLIDRVLHEEFKAKTHAARGVIRTGEFTPYANIILISGVVF